ncbi:MAG: hypothetical protein K9N07_07920 [Candidatus Cloacimonetes bacterium]|nr:hypothetical protein [Candidatus Cloacimonadota bacterium]
MKKYIIILLMFQISYTVTAKEIINIAFSSEKPRIDGMITAGEWDNAYMRSQFYQTSPGNNTEPSEATEIYMMYDKTNLYLMAKCYFKDQNRLRDNHCSRDAIYTTDRCYFYFDTFYSNEKAYYLGCNANGEQADGIVLNDIDTTIDIYYVSKAQKTDYGFLLEIMLPFESIKYKCGKNVNWGFFFKRHIPDGPEEITSSKVNRENGNFYDNYAILNFETLTSDQNLKLIPALIADRSIFKDEIEVINQEDNNIQPELNIFYEPNSSMMTRLTINPDFNIIEADGLEIDVNDRFPRYYQEKRPFFIEQTNPFKTDINIFYTRQIVNPITGFKMSGSFGRTSVFALAAIDEDAPGRRFFSTGEYAERFENTGFGFASVARKYGGNGLLRGAVALRRFANLENLVFSCDGNKRFSQKVRSEFQVAASLNELENTPGNLETEKGIAAALDIDFYNGKFSINNEITAFSEDFTADLGFIDDTDQVKIENRIEYQIHADTDEDMIRYMEFASEQKIKYTFDLQDVKSRNWNLMTGAIFKNTFQFWAGLEMSMDNFFGKDYYTHFPWLNLEYEITKKIRLMTTFVDGVNIFYNYNTQSGEYGDFFKSETTLSLRPNNLLDLEFELKYHETENKYIARSYETKVKLQFHKNFWFRLIVQYIDHDMFVLNEYPKKLSVYPLFAYKPSSKTAIYLGAADNQVKVKSIASQEYLQNSTDTTYFLKISYSIDVL